MNRSTRWLARLTTPVVGAAMVFGAVPAASSATPVSTLAASGASFTGFTDKSELKATGRAVVASAALPVADGSAPAGSGVTYYVDSESGADTNDGTSATTAWRTFANVNDTEFAPGDRILLKAGSSWSAQGSTIAKEAYDYTAWTGGTPRDVVADDPTALLAPKGSGTAASPIVLSSYGEGPAPELNGRGVVNDVLQLSNQEHWDISNLEISNVADGFDPTVFEPGANNGTLPGEENPLTGDLRGIHVQAENAGTLRGYDVHDVFIRDVGGVMWSVSSTGLDRSKRTGGILFEGLKGDGQTVSQFEDISVRDNVIANTAFANLIFKQFSGMGTNRYKDVAPGWGDRAAAGASNTGVLREDPNWRPHTDIDVSGNYMTNRDTEYGWDSMYLTSIQGATIENNMIDGTGVSGIEMYYADDIVVQDNEVAEVGMRENASDSNGIDPDRGTSNILIQGNFVHESGEGILLCGFGFSTAVVRYNVIQDIDKNYINPHGSAGVNVVYNNLMYNTQEPEKNNRIGFFQSSGSPTSYLQDDNRHYMLNNVFVNTREDVGSARFQAEYPGVYFSHNAYHGPQVVPPVEDQDAITGDPRITGNPVEDIANAMIASADSALIAAGTPVDLSELAPGFGATGNSGESQLPLSVGFFGTELTTPPTVGPTSYVPAQGNGLVAGVVVDDAGESVPGATISYGSGTVTADGNGRYAIEAAVGDYTLVPTAEGYADGQPVTVTLSDRRTVSSVLALGVTTATEGAVVGTVTSADTGVAGATVSVSTGDETVATTTTGTDGAYALPAVPAGEGYTVTVEKDGYVTGSQPDVVVRAARTVTIDMVLTVQLGETVYVINETFDDEATGAFTGTGDGSLVATSDSVGTITIEEDAARAGNKYLQLSKLTSSSGTLTVHNAAELNLEGTVTSEARLQRTSTLGTPNQFGMYSYTESGWNAGNPPASSGPAATFGFSGGQIMTHNVTGSSRTRDVAPYTLGQWHTVRNVVDLGTGTFDFYVDDMTTPVLTDQPLRTAVDDLDYFLFFTNGSNKGDLLVDYFRVNTGAPYDYDDSSLGSVTAESADGAVTLTASEDGLTYAGTVHPFAETATISATAGSEFATVAVAGTDVTDGGSVEVQLAAGSANDAEIVTEVPVVVTAEDGTQTSYTVAISRTNPNQLTELRSLAVDGFELSPAFDSDRQGEANPYEVTQVLDASVAAVQLSWDLGWADQPMQVDGRDLPAGTTSATVELEDGRNVIQVTVGSYPGDFATYVLVVTREAAEVPSAEAPSAPTAVSATAADTKVRVRWSAPDQDGGSAVTGYTVTAAPGGATCSTTGETTCVVEGLSNGTAYTFTVTATNDAGTSTASAPSQPVTPGWAPGTADHVSVTLSAKVTCTPDGGQLAVHVKNKEAVKVDLRITTPYGDVKIANVKAGESTYQTFAVPAGDIEAGTGTVAAYRRPGGKTAYSEIEVGWSAARCG